MKPAPSRPPRRQGGTVRPERSLAILALATLAFLPTAHAQEWHVFTDRGDIRIRDARPSGVEPVEASLNLFLRSHPSLLLRPPEGRFRVGVPLAHAASGERGRDNRFHLLLDDGSEVQ